MGDYVVVIYEGEYFPGAIKSIKKTQSQYKVINQIALKPITIYFYIFTYYFIG